MTKDIQIVDLCDNSLGNFYNYSTKKNKSINVAKAVSTIATIVLIMGIFIFYQNVKATSLIDDTSTVALENIKSLFQDEALTTPKLNITVKHINKAQISINKINDANIKTHYLDILEQLYKFEAVKSKLYDSFDGSNILSSLTDEKVEEIKNLMATLPEEQKKILSKKYNLLLAQYTNLDNARSSLKNLFMDEALTIVRDSVTIEELDFVSKKFEDLPQTDEVAKSILYLETVSNYIKEKNSTDKEEYKNILSNSNVEINGIPYISQTASKVYNGSEAASLLMALKFKGFASEYDLIKFAEDMPKHDSDPHQGFINSIYDVSPFDVAHFIAPDALAAFGSKYTSTRNVSGMPTDGIKRYIDKGTPVIVYGTYNFEEVKTWSDGVPLNIHTVLVIGYNKITGNYIVNDPWIGKTTIEKDKFESIYNILKYAVVVE